MSTVHSCPDTKGKSNRPNFAGKQQISQADKIILLRADDYFQNHEHDCMDYRNLYIAIAEIHDIYLPIQSNKHYWLCDDIDKAKRAIRKVNIDAPIKVMAFEHYVALITAETKQPELIFTRLKRQLGSYEDMPMEIKRVFDLLEQGEKINVLLEVGEYGYSIAFHEHKLIGFTHITDDSLNIQYYESADIAIKQLDPLKVFMNCHISLRFTNVAKVLPSKQAEVAVN